MREMAIPDSIQRQPEPIANHLERVYDKHYQPDEGEPTKTYTKRKSDIKLFCEWAEELEFNEVQPHVRLLDEYFRMLKREEYSRNTISSKWDSIIGLYEDLTEFYGVLPENPFERLTRADYLPDTENSWEEKAITKDEMESLCENVPEPKFRNETIIRLAWGTGLRKSEVIDLKMENIDLENNRLVDFWSEKADEYQSVVFGETVAEYLDEWIAEYRGEFPDSEYVFPTEYSDQLYPKAVDEMIHDAAESSGLQEVIGKDKNDNPRHRVSFHSLRHGHASHAVNKADVPLTVAQRQLRHRSLSSTEIYAQASLDEVEESYREFDL